MSTVTPSSSIIPYQEIIGNYSLFNENHEEDAIIPYQEIIGNYSADNAPPTTSKLYHTKK